jgi:hypothetical protein
VDKKNVVIALLVLVIVVLFIALQRGRNQGRPDGATSSSVVSDGESVGSRPTRGGTSFVGTWGRQEAWGLERFVFQPDGKGTFEGDPLLWEDTDTGIVARMTPKVYPDVNTFNIRMMKGGRQIYVQEMGGGVIFDRMEFE